MVITRKHVDALRFHVGILFLISGFFKDTLSSLGTVASDCTRILASE